MGQFQTLTQTSDQRGPGAPQLHAYGNLGQLRLGNQLYSHGYKQHFYKTALPEQWTCDEPALNGTWLSLGRRSLCLPWGLTCTDLSRSSIANL